MNPKGLFTLGHHVTITITNVTFMGKLIMQPILLVTVSVKTIKGAARQHCGDSVVVIRCKWTLRHVHTQRLYLC